MYPREPVRLIVRFRCLSSIREGRKESCSRMPRAPFKSAVFYRYFPWLIVSCLALPGLSFIRFSISSGNFPNTHGSNNAVRRVRGGKGGEGGGETLPRLTLSRWKAPHDPTHSESILADVQARNLFRSHLPLADTDDIFRAMVQQNRWTIGRRKCIIPVARARAQSPTPWQKIRYVSHNSPR